MIQLHEYRGPEHFEDQYVDNSGNKWNLYLDKNLFWSCVICHAKVYNGFVTMWLGLHQMACAEHFKLPLDVKKLLGHIKDAEENCGTEVNPDAYSAICAALSMLQEYE